VIITISREYGAAGRAVSHALADRLGYRVLDEELATVVATRLGTSPEIVDGSDVRRTSFAQRLFRSFSSAGPEVLHHPAEHEDLAASVVREVERHMHEAAAAGDTIVVGRFGNIVLRERPDVLRVFLMAPIAWRVEHIMASLECSEAVARAEIARVDRGRRDSARDRYDFAFGDPHAYDLVIDVAKLGIAGAVETIAAARSALE
jgi:cytidylate kinase